MKKSLFHTVEFGFLLVMMVLFIFLRSLHFAQFLNFSADQATFSLKALEIWRNKSLVLIGPTFSLNAFGRYAFQGPAIYYVQLFFLLIGNFDPVKTSFFFMLFASVMTWPLYYGVKWLSGKKVAAFIVMCYVTLPFFIDYSRFLWNPNFQFVLSPFLILAMGWCAQKMSALRFFLVAVIAGFLLQFHYQFVLVLLGLFFYYFVQKKLQWRYILLWICGVMIGFFPLILFELRHQFYNTQTIFLLVTSFFHHFDTQSKLHFAFAPHYVLSVSFFLLVSVSTMLKKYLSSLVITTSAVILITLSLLRYFPTPTHAFGMVDDWNYSNEQKIAQVIQSENISNFNVVNLIYDTDAAVQRYLLVINNQENKLGDYQHEHFLFVVYGDDELTKTQAYEVKTFAPYTLKKKWQINSKYTLALLEHAPSYGKILFE